MLSKCGRRYPRSTNAQLSAPDYTCGDNCTAYSYRGGSMSDHIDSIMEVVGLLRGSGKPLEDEEVVAVLLTSLPQPYSGLVTALEERQKADLTIEYVTGKMLDEYQRRIESNESEELSTTLQKAIDLVRKATEEDRNRNYEEALRLYEDGIKYLCLLKYETLEDKMKESIRAKCTQFLERAEKIKEYLKKNKKKQVKTGADNIKTEDKKSDSGDSDTDSDSVCVECEKKLQRKLEGIIIKYVSD